MMKLYDWQTKVIDSYAGKGTVKAVTGAGKSLVAVELAKKIGGRILVCSHRTSILDQWKVLMEDIPDVEFETFNVLCKDKYHEPVNLLIVDECHRSVSPEFIKLYDNIEYVNIIGLSATPNEESIVKCGKLLCDIGYSDANISPFKVIFHGIELTPYERAEYYRLSNSIKHGLNNFDNNKKFKTQQDKADETFLQTMIMKRRSIVYNAKARIPLASKLLLQNYIEGKKILVICQRIDQVEILSNILKGAKINHIIYHSKQQDDLNKYRTGEVKVCLSVGMLTHGFDDSDTDVGIIVSTTLSESFNVQSIGRVIRRKDGKFANIHIILANHTTDQKVMQFKEDYNYDFEMDSIFIGDDKGLQDAWYNGEQYSFLGDQIWRRVKGERVYMEPHPITKELAKIKPDGGRFVIYKGRVYTKVDEHVKKIPSAFIRLIPKVEKTHEIDFSDMWTEKKG